MQASCSAKSFIDRMKSEAFNSTAVHHPYLTALCDGSLPNMEQALADFAWQYGSYSRSFVEYVTAVISHVSDEQHAQILRANLNEEEGHTIPEDIPPELHKTIAATPHSLLFTRFQESVGVNAVYLKSAGRCQAGAKWRDSFLELCQTSECIGIGAIGIGTELIVAAIYDQILEALTRHTSLTPVQRVFFELHSSCDDDHADQMLLIAEELALNKTAQNDIEYGAQTAIKLRTTFWNKMLERAQSASTTSPFSTPEQTTELSTKLVNNEH